MTRHNTTRGILGWHGTNGQVGLGLRMGHTGGTARPVGSCSCRLSTKATWWSGQHRGMAVAAQRGRESAPHRGRRPHLTRLSTSTPLPPTHAPASTTTSRPPPLPLPRRPRPCICLSTATLEGKHHSSLFFSFLFFFLLLPILIFLFHSCMSLGSLYLSRLRAEALLFFLNRPIPIPHSSIPQDPNPSPLLWSFPAASTPMALSPSRWRPLWR